MKLSTKIFCGIVALTFCSMTFLAITIGVQARDNIRKTTDVNEFTRVNGCKAIEIGNNWNVSLVQSYLHPVPGITVNSIDIYGVRFINFDSEFIREAKEHIEIINGTLRFKDMRTSFARCIVYVDTSFNEVKISGNSRLTLAQGFTLNRLTINAFESSIVSMDNAFIHNFTIVAHDNVRISGYRSSGADNSFMQIKSLDLYDYSRANFYGFSVSNYRVEDRASFIFQGNFAASKTKTISLKRRME